jgi:hypothetical protein
VNEKIRVYMPVLDFTNVFVNVCHPFFGHADLVYEFRVEAIEDEHVNADIH